MNKTRMSDQYDTLRSLLNDDATALNLEPYYDCLAYDVQHRMQVWTCPYIHRNTHTLHRESTDCIHLNF